MISIIIACYYGLINLLSCLFYGWDKRLAKLGKQRISEKNLFLFSMLGGPVGSLFGMKLFHHKTKKWYFWLINIVFMGLYVALWLYLYLFFMEAK